MGIYNKNNRGNVDRFIDEQSGYLRESMVDADINSQGSYYAAVSGDYGEYTISAVMRSLPGEFHVINNVLLKTKKGSTQIDHIIVCPYGVFVIETKNHKGMIFGDCFGRVWTQVVNGRGRFTFYSPVLQNEGHLRNLCNSIKVPMNYMAGIIVFTNPQANLDNVNCPFCVRADQLHYYLCNGGLNRCLSDKQVINIIKRIDKVNSSGYINDMKHKEYVQGIKARKDMYKMNPNRR